MLGNIGIALGTILDFDNVLEDNVNPPEFEWNILGDKIYLISLYAWKIEIIVHIAWANQIWNNVLFLSDGWQEN